MTICVIALLLLSGCYLSIEEVTRQCEKVTGLCAIEKCVAQRTIGNPLHDDAQEMYLTCVAVEIGKDMRCLYEKNTLIDDGYISIGLL